MYGRAEEVVGAITTQLPNPDSFFYATKVWTQGREAGRRQMQDSLRKLGRPRVDLMQIHNLLDWQTHLPLLRAWKASGKVRYLGITHYTDSRHEELERVMRRESFDFVQFNYSILDRHAEQRLLPAAADLGVATLINRPFSEGVLLEKLYRRPLPPWAAELGVSTWAGFLLKFILSHPAVTCVIPGTSRPEHLTDNLAAATGPLPDAATREKMAAYVQNL
ncbi:aldo/keto reductase [Hymenobacter cellulosilyticus]|uniref:Aldo/keto reductase n=1 Tax=Hymenobacter cellulosilyticus TaxID=2932248 RepID=A0A8T9Q2Q5_9BACT|nr:aldo/keto reductase [Hymenobacter cellulosilyticus]